MRFLWQLAPPPDMPLSFFCKSAISQNNVAALKKDSCSNILHGINCVIKFCRHRMWQIAFCKITSGEKRETSNAFILQEHQPQNQDNWVQWSHFYLLPWAYQLYPTKHFAIWEPQNALTDASEVHTKSVNRVKFVKFAVRLCSIAAENEANLVSPFSVQFLLHAVCRLWGGENEMQFFLLALKR